MTDVTAADTEGPTAMQIDRLRMLSETHLGDPELFLKEAGHPYSRADAGTMLGAFHCLTKGTKPLPGTQTEYVELITRLQADRPRSTRARSEAESPASSSQPAEKPRPSRARSTEGEEPPMKETKTCTKCGEDKPLDDFYKGQGKCKPCFKQHAKEREAKRKGKTSSSKGSAEKKSPDRPSQPDPPLSNGSDVFTNPRLSDLRAFQEILETTCTAVDSVRLEEAAEALALIGKRLAEGSADG